MIWIAWVDSKKSQSMGYSLAVSKNLDDCIHKAKHDIEKCNKEFLPKNWRITITKGYGQRPFMSLI